MQSFFFLEGGGGKQGVLCQMCKWRTEFPWGWITPFRKSRRVPESIQWGSGGMDWVASHPL